MWEIECFSNEIIRLKLTKMWNFSLFIKQYSQRWSKWYLLLCTNSNFGSSPKILLFSNLNSRRFDDPKDALGIYLLLCTDSNFGHSPKILLFSNLNSQKFDDPNDDALGIYLFLCTDLNFGYSLSRYLSNLNSTKIWWSKLWISFLLQILQLTDSLFLVSKTFRD